MNFIKCPKCAGNSIYKGEKCENCSGNGLYAWFGGYILYLPKVMGRGEIVSLKIKKILQIITSILLVLMGLWGLLCLVRALVYIPELIIIPDVLKTWLLKQSYLMFEKKSLLLFFWISVITDLYLFYIIELHKQEKQKSWPKTTRKIQNLPNAWGEVHNLPKKLKIDITSAFSSKSIEVIQKSWTLAKKVGHNKIEPIHIFASLLQVSDTVLAINRLGLNWETLKNKVKRFLTKISDTENNKHIYYSQNTKKVLLYAYNLAGTKNRTALTPLEILQSLVSFKGPVEEIFYDMNVTPKQIENVCLWIDVYNELRQKSETFIQKARFKPKGPINRAYTAMATPYLDTYSHDLTQLARSGGLGMCINRKKEIEQMFRNFESGEQSVILTGPTGVGKTTIVNGLARKMVTEDVPEVLQDKRLVSLSLTSLIAGASQSGEIEQRLQIIMNEVVRSGNIILFIKDIHNIIGVKTTEGEMDISDILANVLKNRLFMIISTTTPSEYQRIVEGSALGTILQKVRIEEPDKDTTIKILEAHTIFIEGEEQVYFSYNALDRAVDLSSRYLYERYLPEKAINLLKQVAVAVKNKRGKQSIIQAEDVSKIIAEKTNIPVTQITQEESEKLLDLEEQIHSRLIDQNEAVDMVASALRRARVEMRSEKRPVVNLLFLGPTGVGKTELAKTVAEVYFGDEEKMVRVDMSEYQEKTSIGRLIGAPGAKIGGQLTEAIRHNPSCILLLDEIEKAHPDILNIFLQVMDDGRLTDVLGRTIDFTNVILIGTSNAGTSFIQEEIKKGTSVADIQEVLIREKLKPHFRPEFLNRFDGVVVFKPLSMDDIKKITKLMLKNVEKQLEKKGIILKATDSAVADLAKAGFDPMFGARPLRRVIQNQVSDVLAEYILKKQLGRRDTVILEKNNQIKIKKAESI